MECDWPTVKSPEQLCGARVMMLHVARIRPAKRRVAISRRRVQLAGAILLAVLLPVLLRWLVEPWELGIRKAKEFLLCAETLSAAEACSLGMVNRVVPAADLAGEARAMAERIAQTAPLYSNLEFDVASGERGQRDDGVDAAGGLAHGERIADVADDDVETRMVEQRFEPVVAVEQEIDDANAVAALPPFPASRTSRSSLHARSSSSSARSSASTSIASSVPTTRSR